MEPRGSQEAQEAENDEFLIKFLRKMTIFGAPSLPRGPGSPASQEAQGKKERRKGRRTKERERQQERKTTKKKKHYILIKNKSNSRSTAPAAPY